MFGNNNGPNILLVNLQYFLISPGCFVEQE